jgi:hypothetical protein
MEIILCELCGKKEKTRVRWCKYVCDDCEPQAWGKNLLIETVFIRDYGYVPKSRIEEMKRRRILPYKPPEGSGKDYYVGRMGENGKISEKLPDY